MFLSRIILAVTLLVSIMTFSHSMVFAWWDQPHRFIGSLTRISGLPQQDREVFRQCIQRQTMYDGLVAPDVGRDNAFILSKLGYAISHQADSAQRSATALYHATKRYAEARQRNDLNGCCAAIFQLSEAIHYLQDSADPTKLLNNTRSRISREISKYVTNELYRQRVNMQRLRTVRNKSKPDVDKIPGGAEDIAKWMLKRRAIYADRINGHFDKYGDPPRDAVENIIAKAKGDKYSTLLVRYIIEKHPDLFNEVQGEIIRVFGMMWAGQDRYLELFAQKQPSPQELCARDLPGSIPQGRTADGKINCVCPQGYVWNLSRTGCEKQPSPHEYCSRNFPGSIFTGRDANGKVVCGCPKGYVPNVSNSGCVQETVIVPPPPKDCSHCNVYENWLRKNAGSCNYQGARLPSICQLDPECLRWNQECNRVTKQLRECQARCQGR